MIIMGIHGGVSINQHDPGCAIIDKGLLRVFIEEERLNRIKGSRGILPIFSILKCLNDTSLDIRQIDILAICGDSYQDIKEITKSWMEHHFGYCPKIFVVNHQIAHIASAFYPSNFEKSLCISYDAYGDKLSGAVALASKKDGIELIEEFPFTNSLGIFYGTMTSYLGFKPGEDEFKVMGLSSYGEPTYDLSFFCDANNDGFLCNSKYFTDRKSPTQYQPHYSEHLVKKLKIPPRNKFEKISQDHKNLASSTQFYLEKAILSLLDNYKKKYDFENLCLAGGVALNCTVNNKISKLNFIEKLYIQPSASDRGLPLGAAIYATVSKGIRFEPLKNNFYGPRSSSNEIKKCLDLNNIKYEKTRDYEYIAELLYSGKIIGWFQGRSEFGPRALGNRSILANPLLKDMKNLVNKKIKFREEFRPFAPIVTEEDAHKYFNLKTDYKHMTVACDVKKEMTHKIPSVVHVDNSARVQTVTASDNPKIHNLLLKFGAISGHPVLMNTSFNIMGQPIVETTNDALSTFFGCGLDYLYIGDYLVKKD